MTVGKVAAGHLQTAQAAVEILQDGGNAFDAAVGAGFAACAAEPVLTSLGGGGFLLAHPGHGKECLYDFFVQTPQAPRTPGTVDFFPIHADFGPTTQEFHIGLGSIAVPGTIAGLFAVQRDLGKLPMPRVLEPAIRLCREGIVVDAFQEYLFRIVAPILRATDDARRVFCGAASNGGLPRQGERIRFPEMAATLEALGREGPELFYRGALAKQLAEQCRSGGCLREADLGAYQVERRKPLEFYYRGDRLLTNPPPSCGGILIAFALKLLESGEDPATVPSAPADLIPLAWSMELTNKARLDALVHDPEWDQAAPRLLEPAFLESYRREIASRQAALKGTTHLDVIDRECNVASLSLSNGEGCGHILKGTGIMLNNMLGEEDINPQGARGYPPDQRMSSMMAPTLLFQKDGTMTALGSGGSNRIRTAIVQVLRHLSLHALTLETAVKFPRLHNERGLLSVEPGFPQETLEALRQSFSDIHLWEEKNLFFGGVHAVSYHPDRGFNGMGDPRRAGVSL